jgi:DNA repair protein RadC
MRRTSRVVKRLNVRPPTGAITPPHRSFTTGLYRKVNGRYRRADDRCVIAGALSILSQNVATGPQLNTGERVREYLAIRLGGLEYEVFCCLYLDTACRVIECEDLFRGSLNVAAAHPREIAKQCLIHNACSLMVAHNHTTGLCKPSPTDRLMTMRIKHALELIDVKLLDHFIVGAGEVCSMAELGLL